MQLALPLASAVAVHTTGPLAPPRWKVTSEPGVAPLALNVACAKAQGSGGS